MCSRIPTMSTASSECLVVMPSSGIQAPQKRLLDATIRLPLTALNSSENDMHVLAVPGHRPMTIFNQLGDPSASRRLDGSRVMPGTGQMTRYSWHALIRRMAATCRVRPGQPSLVRLGRCGCCGRCKCRSPSIRPTAFSAGLLVLGSPRWIRPASTC